jgi:hypothetical protein
MLWSVQRVTQRDGPHIQQRVALTDGAEALQQQVMAHFPAHTLILDVMHATAYVWDTANALLGETHQQRTARGSAPTWSRCWPAKLGPLSRPWPLKGRTVRGRAHNGRRCSRRWATTDGTGRTCATTSTWRMAGRLGRAWWKWRVGTW